MKKYKQIFLIGFAILFLFSGCATNNTSGTASNSSASLPSIASSFPLSSPSNDAIPSTISAPETEKTFRFTNQTLDMTFDFSNQMCAPGESILVLEPQNGFKYTFSGMEREQTLSDVVMFTTGNIEIFAAKDDEKGYSLTVFDDESTTEPVMQYLLIPQGLYWMHCALDQKMYLGTIPQQPIEKLLKIYPDAVLKSGFLSGNWGYTQMLWCYEPLHNVKIGSTNVIDVVDDEFLFAYVDWSMLENIDLTPNAPLFTDIVSVGSSWCLAVQFEDEAGETHIYIAWENGLGGERPGLILHPIRGRILTLEETKKAQEAR